MKQVNTSSQELLTDINRHEPYVRDQRLENSLLLDH